ncbi:two-component system, sensor histidine kinase YesM [Paenibacillus sp. UNC496MF]|uniref:cache domain-containing sensor histidine kinase n=1 Tax=Paenibacillus sp. UNC496MF TaxID=1502753 RepID=UPI0008E67F98|nr:sensor histidine kinase [Paenibacillus sp. UNC496MF]SFI51020.1 two-component system, sensor histidine kinase YesM [Paenibacillus sp. UNC496MF]
MRRPLERYLIRPFLDMRLRNKLFVALGLASVAPLLFFAVYSYETMKNELSRQVYASMATTTDQIGANLKMKLDSYSKVSSSLYLDRRLRDFLSADYTNSSAYIDGYDYLDGVFRNMLVTNSDITSISVYLDNPTLPVDEVYVRRASAADRLTPWYEAASKAYGNVTFTAMPATSPTDQQVTQGVEERKPSRIVLARLLDNDSLNYPYGILTMDIPESDLYVLMAKENRNKDLFIVSDKGVIISARDKAKLNRPLAAFVKGADASGGRTGSFLGQYGGERVYVVYYVIGNGWKVVSIVSYDSLLSNVKLAFSRLFTIAIVCILIAIILIYIAARMFTKRIEKLLQITRRIEREDFDVSAGSVSQDEVGRLMFAMTKMAGRMKALINEVYKKEIAKKEAEMNMLQAQINPHFLYNTLASISALAMRSGDGRIQSMVTHLAKFYRISLNKGKTIVSLGEELRLTNSYIAIQQLRFNGLLHLHDDIDEAALPYPVVKLVLQPFIENAINHAIWDDDAGLNILLKARIEDGTLVLEVIDDGMGMRPETLQRLIAGMAGDDGGAAGETAAGAAGSPGGPGGAASGGYGIRNVDRRIRMTFGDAYGVRIYSRLGIGTTVQLRMPLSGPL